MPSYGNPQGCHNAHYRNQICCYTAQYCNKGVKNHVCCNIGQYGNKFGYDNEGYIDLVTVDRVLMYCWQLLDVGEGFGNFGHQHTLSFCLSGHQHSKYVNFKSETSNHQHPDITNITVIKLNSQKKDVLISKFTLTPIFSFRQFHTRNICYNARASSFHSPKNHTPTVWASH